VNPEHEPDLDRAHALMMAVLDSECTDADRRELDGLLANRPDLAAAWARLQRVKEVTMGMDLAKPPEEVWDRYRRSVLHRTERTVAWVLIAVGGGILGATSLTLWIQSWLASDLPLFVKVAIGSVTVGVALLIVSILRERWHLSRHDPYSKEVER
jgi:ferric-dicitrate binding protein FerR (iron transport regulator)